jgi:hypothetical protein
MCAIDKSSLDFGFWTAGSGLKRSLLRFNPKPKIQNR